RVWIALVKLDRARVRFRVPCEVLEGPGIVLKRPGYFTIAPDLVFPGHRISKEIAVKIYRRVPAQIARSVQNNAADARGRLRAPRNSRLPGKQETIGAEEILAGAKVRCERRGRCKQQCAYSAHVTRHSYYLTSK